MKKVKAKPKPKAKKKAAPKPKPKKKVARKPVARKKVARQAVARKVARPKNAPVTEKDVNRMEQELIKAKKALASLRKKLPELTVQDYTLTSYGQPAIRLSELFGQHEDMILIHNMGKSCRYCTMWADGFNGLLGHLENRAAFVVVSPDAPETQYQFATSRGWKFRLFSSQGTTIAKDLGFESDDGKPWPGVSVLHKAPDGKITRVSKAFFGPGDDYCVTWHLFDLLPGGPKGWEPQYVYQQSAPETGGETPQ